MVDITRIGCGYAYIVALAFRTSPMNDQLYLIKRAGITPAQYL
jgi:hypothetical protein